MTDLSVQLSSNKKKLTPTKMVHLVEATLFTEQKPLSTKELFELLSTTVQITKKQIADALDELQIQYQEKGVNLVKLASGYQFIVSKELSNELNDARQAKPVKLSRAMLETLALIAYKQPITRSEIEDVRGVAVGSQIIRGLLDREWIRMVGHKDVPGRPAMYGTTKAFLDHFSLKSIKELPELKSIEEYTFDPS